MTSLADNRRVVKSSTIIDALGNLDELNSLIGILLSEGLPSDIQDEMIRIQNDLFDLGAELAGSSQSTIEEKQILRLENEASKYDANLLSLEGFILPGGSKQGAFLHYIRSACRRAERAVFSLAKEENISPLIGKYLNRLSDLFFIYARSINHESHIPERLWQKHEK